MAFRLLDSFLPWDLRYTNTKKRLRLRENQGERKENQRSVAGEGANGNQSQPSGNCHPMIPDGLHVRFSFGRGDRLGENPFTANWLGGSKDLAFFSASISRPFGVFQFYYRAGQDCTDRRGGFKNRL